MIMLSGKNKVDCNLYDHVWYVTTTCPGMRVGCEHHPELAASKELHKYCYPPYFNEDNGYNKFLQLYAQELRSEPRLSLLKDLVRRSEQGEWFQLIFYEDDPQEGERPVMFELLRTLTNNVNIE